MEKFYVTIDASNSNELYSIDSGYYVNNEGNVPAVVYVIEDMELVWEQLTDSGVSTLGVPEDYIDSNGFVTEEFVTKQIEAGVMFFMPTSIEEYSDVYNVAITRN